jgi:hypothetical protein
MFSIIRKFDKFIIFCLFLTPIVLLVGYDFSFVTYDSEPDYISAAFHINQFGIPYSSQHPGIITQYLISFPLLVGDYLNLPFNFSIILIRFTELAILAGLIMVSINLMTPSKIQTKLFYYSAVWLLIFLFPSSSVLFRYISAEILLFGISFLTCSVWFKHLKFHNNCLFLGILIAAGMNIKSTFIFLLIVLSFFHLLTYAYFSKTLKGVETLIKIFIYGVIFFTIFSIPKIFEIMPNMANIFKDWIQIINSILSPLELWQFFLLGVVIFTPILLFYWLKKIGILSHKKANYTNYFISEAWVIAIPVALFVLYKLYFYYIHPEIDYLVGLGQWESLGIMRRNSIPLYAFIVFFIIKELIKKNLILSNLKSLLFAFLLMIICAVTSIVSATKPFIFEKNDIALFDQTLMDLIKIEPDAKIYIHHDNYFDSVIQFYLWTSIRYGNCNNQKLLKSLKASYPELIFDNFSYVSIKGVSKCNFDLSNEEYESLYNKWLFISNNVEKIDLCLEFNSISNDKIFLIDKRFIDAKNTDEIVNKLNSKIEECGFKMVINNNYFLNNEIHAYDIHKF